MAKLKVFGGLQFGRGRVQVRTIVASSSKKKAAGLVGESFYHFSNYWLESGADKELEVALASPEVVFQASSSMGDDFLPVMIYR